MQRASTSLELSEFFDKDDSEGNRLVDFLQRKRGGAQKQNYLFINYEPQRFSLDVQLEKLSPTQKASYENSDGQTENEKEHNKTDNNIGKSAVKSTEKRSNTSQCKTGETLPSETNATTCFEVPEGAVVPLLPCEPVVPISQDAQQNYPTNECPTQPFSPRAISPPVSFIRKVFASASPSDRLRRYSLKRLRKFSSGRRTLLQEFENTIGGTDFQPPVCSTPLSQPQPKPLSFVRSSEPLEIENDELNAPANSVSINESSGENTDKLMATLQRKDELLKNYMESIVEKTLKKMQCEEKENRKSSMNKTKTNPTVNDNTSLKRAYTIEKGNIPGQVILTPDKSMTEESPHRSVLLRPGNEPTPSKLLRPGSLQVNMKELSNSPHCISHRDLNMRSTLEQQDTIMSPNRKIAALDVPNTPPQRNMSVAFSTEDVEIPETQNQPIVRQNSIIIQSDIQQAPIVLIPINQTFNKCIKENPKETNENLSTLPAQLTHKTYETNSVECYRLAEDNLKLTDILTDDDEDKNSEATSSRTAESKNQVPLNLARSATTLRTTRLQKRSFLRRRLQLDNSQRHCTETENEPPPLTHNNKRLVKKKHIPLNKAPGIPLNGEQFAEELARMSNYEILDLRKRNSMDQVFALPGRKSRRSHEEAAKRKQKLDDEIEKELIRRKLDEITDKQSAQCDQSIVEGEEVEYPQVPDEFRDSSDKKQYDENNEASSLVGERSSDRISFKKKIYKRQPKRANKQAPEVLKLYLEVSKLISQRKSINYLKQFKRSLYTHGLSFSEDTNSSGEHNLQEGFSKNMKLSIPCVPSPPKSDREIITTPKVVSPPPPLTITHRKSTTQQQLQSHLDDNAPLPPPPSGFESCSPHSSDNFDKNVTTDRITQSADTNIKTTDLNTNHNEYNHDLFKKPELPVPKKRRYRKRNMNKTPANELLQSSTDSQQSANPSADLADGTLRRSKRGQVPLKLSAPILQSTYQKTLDRRMQYFINNIKKKKSETSKSIAKNNESKSSTKEAAGKRSKIITVSESGPFVACPPEDSEKPKKTKTKKNKKTLEQNKSQKEIFQPTDNFECSNLILSNPPPVDHLNNMFDQLRNSISRSNTLPQQTSSSLKVKPFKIRVARLKSSVNPINCDSVSTTCCTNSNSELISWLKNITEPGQTLVNNEEIFKEMRISAASSLSFSEVQGVEYAFYDTDEKACLGYLRFQPRQIKSKKKAKRFHLHFVALVGIFRVTANDKVKIIHVGDMVAIEKKVYYDIENLTDDVGILMVVKK